MTDFPDVRGTTGAQPVPPPARPEVITRALNLFEQLDKNGNGYLSNKELKDALQSRNLKGHDAAAVAAIFDMKSAIEDVHADRSKPGVADLLFGGIGLMAASTHGDISRKDLENYEKTKPTHAARETELQFDRAVVRVEHANPVLFPEGIKSITPAGVRQGSIGDCYFLSAVAGLAGTNPARILNMIQPHADGSFTVKFPKKTVEVPPLTEADFATFSGTPNGSWVTVLEKAYYKATPDAEDGGLTGGIRTLMGDDAAIYYLPLMSVSAIKSTLETATKNKDLMVVSRTFKPKGSDGVSSGHVLTIEAYDRKSDTVTVRNPYGTGGRKDTGYLYYDALNLRKGYDFIAVEQKPSPSKAVTGNDMPFGFGRF